MACSLPGCDLLKTSSTCGSISSPSGTRLDPVQLTKFYPIMGPDGAFSCNIRASGGRTVLVRLFVLVLTSCATGLSGLSGIGRSLLHFRAWPSTALLWFWHLCAGRDVFPARTLLCPIFRSSPRLFRMLRSRDLLDFGLSRASVRTAFL